jgi:hypothetical protein
MLLTILTFFRTQLENELIDQIFQIDQKSKNLAFLPPIPRTSVLLFKEITVSLS